MEAPLQTTAVGQVQQIPCSKCGQMALSTRRFCGACGCRLWEPCLKCGTHNSVAERFCSQCGSDLPAALEAALSALDRCFARSEGLEQEGKLLEAADCIENLPESDHSQLASRLQAASERRAMLINRREQAVAQRVAVLEQAQKLREGHQYVAALAVLEQVPSSLRDQQIRALVAELDDLVRQIKQLRARLHQSIKDGPLDELITLAERLLKLEPEADDARRLRDQLHRRRDERDAALALPLLKQAREAIGGNDYARAEKCLAKISAAAAEKLTDDQRKLREAIDERVWLDRQLRIAPYADKSLLQLSARLAKRQPDDQQVRKLNAEISARLARADSRIQPVFVPWKRAAGEWVLGAPVEPLQELRGLAWDTGQPKLQSWASATRRHLVAAGLALHALGAARLDLELKKKDGATWLSRLTDARRKRALPAAWGLDFGTSGLKAVRLARDKETITVECSATIPYGDSPIGAAAPDVQLFFAAALRQFLDQFSPGNEPLVVGFPGSQTLGRFIHLPAMDVKKVAAALKFEVANQIPLPLDQVVHSWHAWDAGKDDEPAEWHIAVVAAKQTHVDLRLGPFVESHARAWSLESDCVALLNLMLHSCDSQIESLRPDEAIALVEVGDSATNIIAISPQRGPWFRTIYRGLRSLNAPLVAALGITWQQADELRQNWASARGAAQLDNALSPGIEQMTRELRQTLRIGEQLLRSKFKCVYLAGGGCDQFGLLRHWARAGESRHTSYDGVTDSVACTRTDAVPIVGS